MEKLLVSARVPADLASEFALVARQREQTTSALLRVMMLRAVREHGENDDPAGQGEVVGSTPRRTASVAKA